MPAEMRPCYVRHCHGTVRLYVLGVAGVCDRHAEPAIELARTVQNAIRNLELDALLAIYRLGAPDAG